MPIDGINLNTRPASTPPKNDAAPSQKPELTPTPKKEPETTITPQSGQPPAQAPKDWREPEKDNSDPSGGINWSNAGKAAAIGITTAVVATDVITKGALRKAVIPTIKTLGPKAGNLLKSSKNNLDEAFSHLNKLGKGNKSGLAPKSGSTVKPPATSSVPVETPPVGSASSASKTMTLNTEDYLTQHWKKAGLSDDLQKTLLANYRRRIAEPGINKAAVNKAFLNSYQSESAGLKTQKAMDWLKQRESQAKMPAPVATPVSPTTPVTTSSTATAGSAETGLLSKLGDTWQKGWARHNAAMHKNMGK
jgi:hypothetical protein